MSVSREAFLAVVQDEHGNQETELVTIETGPDGSPRSIELTNGGRITIVRPAAEAPDEAEAA